MKKIHIITGLLIIFISLVFSCNRSEDNNQNYTEEYNKIFTKISEAGKVHNRNLDIVKNRLLNDKSLVTKYKSLSSKVAVLNSTQFISDMNNLEFTSISEDPFYNDLTDEEIMNNINNVNVQIVNEVANPDGTLDFSNPIETQTWFSQDEPALSNKEKELLTILKNTIENTSLSFEQSIQVFDEVYNRSLTECNDKEKLVIKSAVVIGKNSMTYWYQNADTWKQAISKINPNSSITSRRVNWHNVAAMDVAGAVGGAVRTWVLGVYGGPVGVSAYVGSICATAFAGSATNAVYQWLSQ